MSQIIFIIVMLGGFIIPPIIFAQWWLLGVFVAFFCCFGIIEFIAVKTTGKSVSQQIWQLKEKNKTAAWIIVISMQIAWLSLLWHFIG